MSNADIGTFILFMVALIFSGSVHESLHAWTSSHFGDDLARSQGRVSLNPLVHIDPIGTLLFPAISFFTGAAMLGWAKSTPVNPLKWRDKRVANFWVSIAGILGNLTIAIVAGIVLRVLFEAGVFERTGSGYGVITDSELVVGVVKLVHIFFTLNVALAVFNLLPIPPLDGISVLESLLPESFGPTIEAVQRYGFVLLFIALFTGVLNPIFGFVMPLAERLVFIGAS
jgi:Zn-dependent protease